METDYSNNGRIKSNRRFKQTCSHLSSIAFLSPAPSRITVSSLEIVNYKTLRNLFSSLNLLTSYTL